MTSKVFELPDTYTAPPRSIEEHDSKMDEVILRIIDDFAQDIAPPLSSVQSMFVKLQLVKEVDRNGVSGVPVNVHPSYGE